MDPKVQLAREYCKLLDSKILWLLKFTGYLRFATNNGHIVKRNATTAFVRCLNSIISGNSSAFYMFYVLSWRENYLIQSEVILLVLIAVLQNSILLNMAGPNRNTGLILLNYCMEIDCHLGVKPTKFMRDIAVRTFLTLSIFIFSFQAIIVTVLVFAYKTPLSIHVVGTIYFTLLFMIFYDICFLLTFYAFLALRVHYLSVAIIKRAGVSAGYFPKQFLFHKLLWRKEFDNLVTFHKFATTEQFSEGFKIIFNVLQHVEKCYRFTIFMGMCAVTLGTFNSVPVLVTTDKSPEYSFLRKVCVIGWVIVGWLYEYGLGQQTDLFCHQIDMTKLICTYIQLKPRSSACLSPLLNIGLPHRLSRSTIPSHLHPSTYRTFAQVVTLSSGGWLYTTMDAILFSLKYEILKLTRSILNTLEIREPRLSLYGMCFLNTGLVLRFAASIFVYITVQLQILIPAIEDTKQEPATLSRNGVFLFGWSY